MIKDLFYKIFSKWSSDKAIAIEKISLNKALNAKIESKNLPKITFSLYELETAKIISELLPDSFYLKSGLSRSKYLIKGSIGKGNPSEIPWICIFDLEITNSAQHGYYIAFLFDSKMQGVYLSLNQGWTQYENEFGIKEGKIQIKKNSLLARSFIFSDQGFSHDPINLHSNSKLAKGYETGNICSKFYSVNDFPEEDELLDDLRILIGVYRELKGHVGSHIIDLSGKINEDLFQEEIQKGSVKILRSGPIEKKDKIKNALSYVYPRNCNIAFTALVNANFTCENNPDHFSFISATTNRQFVEAHHLIPMEFQIDFKYSIDVPENIISLCPNCHRAFHNSIDVDKERLIKKFVEIRFDSLTKRGIKINLQQLLNYYLKNKQNLYV